MQRYFVPAQQIDTQTCRILGQDAHHILHVLRMKPGDQLICSDGLGKSMLARIAHVTKHEVICDIVESLAQDRELPIRVSIAQGLPKGDKLEWIIQKGTELGAHHFFPFISTRTVVKYDGKKEAKKLERWKKIIKEAAEQSHRDVIPDIHDIQSFKELLQLEADVKLVAYEDAALQEAQAGIQGSIFYQALQEMKQGQSVVIAIGPEGGFEEQEIKQLVDHGYQTVGLGKRILRTETASQYVLAAISFYFEQIGR